MNNITLKLTMTIKKNKPIPTYNIIFHIYLLNLKLKHETLKIDGIILSFILFVLPLL